MLPNGCIETVDDCNSPAARALILTQVIRVSADARRDVGGEYTRWFAA